MLNFDRISLHKTVFWILFLPLLISQAILYSVSDIPSLTLTQRQTCDLELILNEGFFPLKGFMDSQDYEGVVHHMRLADGTLWPIPIVLDIQDKELEKIGKHKKIALRDLERVVLAYLDIAEVWQPDKEREALQVYGTTSPEHPGVAYLFNQTGKYYLGGVVSQVAMPKHYDFPSLRKTPQELKTLFKEHGYNKVIGFQTRNPMHRAHVELTIRAAQDVNAHLLIHPSVGMTKPGDIDHFTRVKCYQKLLNYYPEGSTTLSLLPLAMRMAGPREAVWHAIIRKNYGCTHFIVGRDHAGPGKNSQGQDFYAPYAAQELVQAYSKEIGIEVVPFKEMVYVQEDQCYQPIDEVELGKTILTISGTQLRKMLREGLDIPDWFSFPEVLVELKKVYPPRSQQGFTLFLTGLSGSGKSTLANALLIKLMELQDRRLTLLDGDVIRNHLSSELGFSQEHRSLNVRRVGFVASEITKNHGIAICALIAPYEEDRSYNRNLIGEQGGYIEIYVATPLHVCEERDSKGLYMLARQGKLPDFTGIDAPYEEPKNPEIIIDNSCHNVVEEVDRVLEYLYQEGYMERVK